MANGQRAVVIVEDDESMSQAISRILRIAGYAPVAFDSGEALVSDGSASRAACLVLDVQLPGMTGFELYGKVARSGRHVPVIFITAYDEPEARRRAREAGAVAYLTKPFAGRDLVDAVTQAHGGEPPPVQGRRWRNGH